MGGAAGANGRGPALGVLEVGSIARALRVADELVKRAPVEVVAAEPVSPGKLVLVFAGGEAEVEESLVVGREHASTELVDELFLPQAHAALLPGLRGVERPPVEGALGVLELGTVAATLLAGDAALKAAAVELCTLALARGIGGKGYLVFTGAQDAVEASLEAGDAAVPPQRRVGRELIARPHPDLDWVLARWGRPPLV